MGALVSVGRGSGGNFVTPYSAVAAVSARPRRSPFVIATIDLVAVVIAFGAFQIVSAGVSGMRDVAQITASEHSGGGMTVVAAPPMPQLAGERTAMMGELPTEEILFAEPVVLEATFGTAIGGPPPDRFALVEPQAASSGNGASGAPLAASESSNPPGPILSYGPPSSPEIGGETDGPVTRTVVATVSTVDRSTEAVMEALPTAASGAVETVASGIANQATAAAPVASVTAPVVDSAASGAAAVTETATSTVNSVVSTTTSTAGGVVSGTTSTVSNVAGAVGGLLN